MVDLRSNMHFATRGCYKSVNASRAAALLSWAAHHRGDRLGGLIFGNTTHRELKPRLGRQAALRFLHELAEHRDWSVQEEPRKIDSESPLTMAMASLRRVARPGSLVVILSDFVGLTRAAQSYLSSVARHNEVLAVCVSDPLERDLSPPGRYRLVRDEEEIMLGNDFRQLLQRLAGINHAGRIAGIADQDGASPRCNLPLKFFNVG